MNNAVSTEPDALLCTYIKADSNRRQYIRGYIPHSDKHIAHHMVLFGCKKPALMLDDPEKQYWSCGVGSIGICEEEHSENIIYAWALNAGELAFPEDTGLRIGGDTDLQYLVLQMHYKEKFEDGKVDNSGLSIKLTYDEMDYQVGLFVLGNYGYIPPKIENFRMETGCVYKYPFDVVPFAYRVHAHNLGRVISGYIVKENGNIYEIGRMSPQQPQLFYNVTTPDTLISQNDIIISTCKMNSMSRDKNTGIGPKNNDEMCNFYILYYTNFNGDIKDYFCFRDAQNFSWKNDLNFIQDIENDNNLNGVQLIEPENEKHMEMSHGIKKK